LTKTQNKTQKCEAEKFVSPLQQYINENCVGGNCPRWKQLQALKQAGFDTPVGCNTLTENGIDQMFLCMTAKGLQTAETDPAKILEQAASMGSLDFGNTKGDEQK
jgi:hypothetical protein